MKKLLTLVVLLSQINLHANEKALTYKLTSDSKIAITSTGIASVSLGLLLSLKHSKNKGDFFVFKMIEKFATSYNQRMSLSILANLGMYAGMIGGTVSAGAYGAKAVVLGIKEIDLKPIRDEYRKIKASAINYKTLHYVSGRLFSELANTYQCDDCESENDKLLRLSKKIIEIDSLAQDYALEVEQIDVDTENVEINTRVPGKFIEKVVGPDYKNRSLLMSLFALATVNHILKK